MAVLLFSVGSEVAFMLYWLSGWRDAVAVGGFVLCIGLGFLVVSVLPRRLKTEYLDGGSTRQDPPYGSSDHP